jgi:hypothetical protein
LRRWQESVGVCIVIRVIDVVVDEMFENGFKVFKLSIVERVDAFGAWELPTLFPKFLNAAAVPVILCEEVAEDPISVRHDVNNLIAGIRKKVL